jgi:hypothetical protein
MTGKALDGRHLGGTHYGYDRDLVTDPTRKDEHGREAIAYVQLKKNSAQGAIIIDIFNLRAAGKSLTDITKHLNKQSVPGPRGKGWSYTGVRTILNDELYIGIKIWNTTMNVKDPDSGKVVAKPRPQTEWIIKEMPELGIVPQDLWEKVQQINENAKKFGRQRLGGMNRTELSRTYLFSGPLKCGLCGGSMTIVGGGNRVTRYGCRAHRQEAKCSNKATIRVDRLEAQLLDAIIEKLQPEVIDKSLGVLQQQIEAYLADQSRVEKLDEADLKSRVQQLKKEQSNVIRAIASLGGSDPLFDELTRVGKELKQVNKELELLTEATPDGITFEEFKAFVRRKANDLKCVLRGDPALAKQTISRIVQRLVLTPVGFPDGPVFEVTGDIDLFAEKNCVLLNSALDRTTKHYTSLLSLTGLQLDPRKVVQIPEGSTSGLPPMPIQRLAGSEGVPAA